MITAKDLHRTYTVSGEKYLSRAEVKALAGVSFEVEQGKTLAVVGESGCGKSTLARLLTLVEAPTSGELFINGTNVVDVITKKDKVALRRFVQIVFQDPYGSLNPRQKIGNILAEPLVINTDMSAAERRAVVLAMLEKVGLRPEHYNRYPHMFSGGQRQRIAIARAIILKPKIVVLDEPVSALDVSIQAQILNLLADLKEELQLTFVFISHDLSVVRFVAEEVMVMYLGRPVEYGSCEEIFNNPQHPYTKALLSARPVADPTHQNQRIALSGELPSPLSPPSGCAFHPRCPLANERCSVELPLMPPQMNNNSSATRVACFAVEENRSE